MLAMKEKEGTEAKLLLMAEGRVEEGMMGWKDIQYMHGDLVKPANTAEGS